MLCVFLHPHSSDVIRLCSDRWQNVHNTNHCCEVTVGEERVRHVVVQKQLLFFFFFFLLPQNFSFLYTSTEFIPCSCSPSLLTIHPLSTLLRGKASGSVYIGARMFFSVEKKKNVWDLLVCVCVCVSFAVAAVNGKRQPSLATKSVSHALALQPLPWQPRLCTRRFLPLCFYTERLLASKRLQRGPFNFLSPFFKDNPESLVPTVRRWSWAQFKD